VRGPPCAYRAVGEGDDCSEHEGEEVRGPPARSDGEL